MKTMKNILLIMLAGVAMMMSSCSKDSPVDPVAPVNPPAPADRWEDILTCNIDQAFPEDEYGPAIIRCFLIASGGNQYYINFKTHPKFYLVPDESQLYLSGYNVDTGGYEPCQDDDLDTWYNGDGVNANAAAKYMYVCILPKVGTFDFRIEIPAANPLASKSYRTKLLRLKIDQNESGVWSAEFLPIQN